jgi:hypothetical protein
VAGLANLGVLRNDFAYDDVRVIDALQQHRIHLAGVPASRPSSGAADEAPMLRDQDTRPVTYALHLLDYRLWGEKPFGFHLTNLLLHMLATALVFVVARAWTRSDPAALVTSLVFAVHPLHVEVVASFANRKDVLALVFDLAAVLAWLRIGPLVPRLLVSGVCLALGLASKEVAAIGVPFVLMAFPEGFAGKDDVRPRPWQVWTLRMLAIALGIVIVAGLRFGARLPYFDSAHIGAATEMELHDYAGVLANAALGVLRMVRLLIVPIGLAVDYPVATDATLATPQVWLGLMVLAAMVVLPLRLYRRHPRVALAFAWVLILYLPISNLVPLVHFFFADRYAYVPSFGYCLLLGMGFAALARRLASRPGLRHGSVALAAIVIVLLGILNARRVAEWRSDLTLWSAAARQGIDTYRVHHKLGISLLLASDANAAAASRELERAIAMRPGRVDDYQFLTGAYFVAHRAEDAWREANAVLRLDSTNAVCRFIRGELRLQRGDPSGALQDYRAAIASDSTHFGAMIRAAALDLAQPGQPGALEEALTLSRRAATSTAAADPGFRQQALDLARRAEAALRPR